VIVHLHKKGDPLGPYLRGLGASIAPRLRSITYKELRSWDTFPSATYLFTEVAGLNESQMALATRVWDRLSQGPTPVRLLNDPRRVLGRYELLRVLHDRGLNSHRAYRLREAHRARFPVFLRRERRHYGVTRLLWSRSELARAVLWATRRKGWPRDDLLVVEFVDTAGADGLYNKYGAFYVCGRVLPRHLVFRPGWMVKAEPPPPPVPQHVDLWREYLEANPHESWIREAFEAAHIDYGRIDYSMHGDRPTVWEINTNPMPIAPEPPTPPHLEPLVRRFAEAFDEALEAIDIEG
jgi:hypothetical protein